MLPDNRLRFDATRIDFAGDVGEVGQDHEDFPAADAQPRYDWLRMWYIALLANQASYDEPTQYRDGTLWFDLNTLALKIWNGTGWVLLSEVVHFDTGLASPATISMQEWYTQVSPYLLTAAPELTFSGISDTDSIDIINVPVSLQSSINEANSRPFIWINGLLIDPRNSEFFTTATIKLLNGIVLNEADVFTVVVKNITTQLFHIPTVSVP